MRWLFYALLLAALALPGCVTDRQPARFDAFAHNKLAILARNVGSARDAHTTATDQIVATLRLIRARAWTGAKPQDAYDLVRRQLATCESRYHSAQKRVKLVKSSSAEYFDQWGRELEDYDDKNLREESRRNLNDYKARLKVVTNQMDEALTEMDKAIGAIQDQMLFIKHHRTDAALPDRPQPVVEPVTHADKLVNLTSLVVLRADDFISRAQVAK